MSFSASWCAVFKWASFHFQHGKCLSAVGILHKRTQTPHGWFNVCACCHFSFLHKKQVTSSKGAWKKHLPVPGHWLQNSHRRTMKTWAVSKNKKQNKKRNNTTWKQNQKNPELFQVHTILGGSWQSPLKHIICIMQGSARGFLRGTKTSFCTCLNHSLTGSVEWGWEQGLAWAGNMPGTSLHQINLISFHVQQTQQNKSFYNGFPLVYGKQSKGRKKELEGFIISLVLFSFQHSSLFSPLQEMQLLSRKTTGTAIPTVQFLLVLCA